MLKDIINLDFRTSLSLERSIPSRVSVCRLFSPCHSVSSLLLRLEVRYTSPIRALTIAAIAATIPVRSEVGSPKMSGAVLSGVGVAANRISMGAGLLVAGKVK